MLPFSIPIGASMLDNGERRVKFYVLCLFLLPLPLWMVRP